MSTRSIIGKSKQGSCHTCLLASLTRRRYHDENTKLEDLTHPEDIEHFKKHEQMEEEEERLEKMEAQAIVLDNVPQKFRRE